MSRVCYSSWLDARERPKRRRGTQTESIPKFFASITNLYKLEKRKTVEKKVIDIRMYDFS